MIVKYLVPRKGWIESKVQPSTALAKALFDRDGSIVEYERLCVNFTKQVVG